MDLVRAVLGELRDFGLDTDSEAFHQAFCLILDEHDRPARPIDDETWVRHAAQQLLVALHVPKPAPDDYPDDAIPDRADEAWRLLVAGNLDEAASMASQALADVRASEYPEELGNDVHHANLVLGHVHLRRGDLVAAEECLAAAGATPGSPQLDSFGPNMSLAEALLDHDRTDAVLRYFDQCATFWDERFSRLPQWRAHVRAGERPSFGPNLRYGIPRDATED